MRNWLKPTVLSLLLPVCLVLLQAPIATAGEPAGVQRPVDFRMAPLEQAKKINLQLHARNGAGQTLTVMKWDGQGDGHHLILAASKVTPATIRGQLTGGIDSVSWFHRPYDPMGSCDSSEECEQKTDDMCEDAGHGGVNEDTVTITMHADGSKTCSGDCESNGAVAFVTCNP